MPKQPKEKSAHLQELEAVFDRHTRRFSPFAVLGLRPNEAGSEAVPHEEPEELNPPTHTGVDVTHPHDLPTLMGEDSTPLPGGDIHTRVVVEQSLTTTVRDPQVWDVTSTHTGVDVTHPHDPPTTTGEDSTPLPGEDVHTRVVVKQNLTTTARDPQIWDVPPTPIGVDGAHPHNPPTPMGIDKIPLAESDVTHTPAVTRDTLGPSASTDVRIQDVLAATQVRTQLGKKARQVLGYLNSIRSLERPAYTVPVGYTQISAAADVHAHYLRRNVLPKLAMLGLIGIVHKSLQGTIYHLHYDAAFLSIVAEDDAEPLASVLPPFLDGPAPMSLPLSPPAKADATLPSWIDRDYWGWLPLEGVQQLVAKAGSEAQAQEKLDIILYNEAHGPAERRVRDRRAVLAHYLRTPHADIWPNDDGFETLALRRMRQEREQALQEKALAEEILHVRQEAAQARFLASLAETQLQWLKQEAKQRVDAQSSARFLTSRYPLYKAEEEQLIHEWMDRIDYGENVPHAVPEKR